MVDKIEIWNNGVLIYKTIRKTKNIVKKKAQIKRKFNYEHKRRKMGTKYVEGRRE